jgi:hypothetical protein
MSVIGPKPELIGDHSRAHYLLDERVLRGIGLLRAGAGITISWDGEQYIIESTARGGGGTTSPVPTELDPTVATRAGDWKFVSPNNPLATIGLTDIDVATTLKAAAGLWICLKDVAAKSGSNYRVPKDPVTAIATVPGGSPLAGALEASTSYWLLVKPVC